MFHIVVCDDERALTEHLEALIQQYAAEKALDFRVTCFADGAALLQDYPMDADLIFLDIQMSGLNGLQTAEEIRKSDAGVGIIFLTSMAQYALEGYKYNATNFIIKPIQYPRLKAELDRWLAQRPQSEAEYILIANDTGKYKVLLRELQYIETFGRNLMVHTQAENLVAYRKLKEFEAQLPAASFVRCHAGYLVNLLFVKRVERLEIKLTTGERVPISQPRRKAVMAQLAAYWGGRL